MQTALMKLFYAFAFIIISILLGSFGYMLIENYNFRDGVYMSVITFSTVGFQEVQPLSDDGKLFTVFYIIINLGLFAYTASVISSYLFEGRFREIYKTYTDRKALKKLNNHIIICGFGKNGEIAGSGLRHSNKELLFIEKNADLINNYNNEKGYQFLHGDAVLESVLIEAGVERASTLITTLPSDADNVFITLTAKEINPQIQIIAKATERNTEKKLRRAGADHIVMPDRVGGSYMASLVTKPSVVEFLELLNGDQQSEYSLEEINHNLLKDEFKNLSIGEMDVKNKTGATVLAFKDKKQGFVFNPNSEVKCNEGDVLILLGDKKSIQAFKDKFVG
ncbi:potassium channel family protein [Marivirga arenosa]|uniref:NAD-binding protein n=1 Tax=Marivirga arenosa TaxID=3059076 RepID=A0AA49GHD3_9BACT|nr:MULTISPECIES: NAD-binding protein [unclassified Marivirga]WKK82718.2 NAD-binding protein [Marivirga sp. BKB1-2]WMN07770.1 NAD-binding protein [Marivirga sp. ABR2-2]